MLWLLVHELIGKALRSPDTACASPRKAVNKPATLLRKAVGGVLCHTRNKHPMYFFSDFQRDFLLETQRMTVNGKHVTETSRYLSVNDHFDVWTHHVRNASMQSYSRLQSMAQDACTYYVVCAWTPGAAVSVLAQMGKPVGRL